MADPQQRTDQTDADQAEPGIGERAEREGIVDQQAAVLDEIQDANDQG